MTLYDLIRDVRNRKSLDVLPNWCLLDCALAHSHSQTSKFSCLTEIPDPIFRTSPSGLISKKKPLISNHHRLIYLKSFESIIRVSRRLKNELHLRLKQTFNCQKDFGLTNPPKFI